MVIKVIFIVGVIIGLTMLAGFFRSDAHSQDDEDEWEDLYVRRQWRIFSRRHVEAGHSK